MPCAPASPQVPRDPISHPSCCRSLPALLQSPRVRQGLPQGWAPLELPCTVSGHVAPGAGVARVKPMLTPASPPPSPRRAGAAMDCQGLIPHGSGAVSHPGWPHAETAPPQPGPGPLPYGAPGRLPAPGQVLLSGLHKTPLSGPGALPSPGSSPSTAGQAAQPAGHGHILL